MSQIEQLWHETDGAIDVLPTDYQAYLDGEENERNRELKETEGAIPSAPYKQATEAHEEAD